MNSALSFEKWLIKFIQSLFHELLIVNASGFTIWPKGFLNCYKMYSHLYLGHDVKLTQPIAIWTFHENSFFVFENFILFIFEAWMSVKYSKALRNEA